MLTMNERFQQGYLVARQRQITMKFSDRLGITNPIKKLQIDSIDEDLLNGLWNAFQIKVVKPLENVGFGSYRPDYFQYFCKPLWHDFFKLPIDTLPDSNDAEGKIRKWFFEAEWFEIYNFIEYIAQIQIEYVNFDHDDFIQFCNNILEREFSGYRFILGKISPITNEHEIMEIENAIESASSFTSLNGANVHLRSALSKLSDKTNPDYRNSIKESITAIESVAKTISKGSKDTLYGALDKIKTPLKLHQSQVTGFKSLYSYTSDSGGIRHALMDDSVCDFDDAKYMLVSSSAFINYLLSKAEKANISLT